MNQENYADQPPHLKKNNLNLNFPLDLLTSPPQKSRFRLYITRPGTGHEKARTSCNVKNSVLPHWRLAATIIEFGSRRIGIIKASVCVTCLSLRQITQTSALIIPHILLDLIQ